MKRNEPRSHHNSPNAQVSKITPEGKAMNAAVAPAVQPQNGDQKEDPYLYTKNPCL